MTHATIPPMLDHRRAADTRRSSRRPVAVLVALVLLVAACGSNGPSASPGSPSTSTGTAGSAGPGPSASVAATPFVDPATVYQTIEDQVVAIRGLHPKATVSPTLLDDAGLKKLVADSFAKDNPPDVMAANERIMKALGLLPADA